MLSLKSTIYQTGWLDLVFENRNKSYGAYELRQNYNKRLGKALLIACFPVAVLVSYPLLMQHLQPGVPVVDTPAEKYKETIVDLSKMPRVEIKEQKPAAPASAPKSEPAKTIRSVEPVAVSTPVTEEPPRVQDLMNAVISTHTTEGAATTANVPVESGNGSGIEGSGAVNGSGDDESIYSAAVLERYPEFPGGMEAFAKFLRKNLRYPEMAREAGVSGKVFLSFVVERDGRLSDIKILRGLGYGCDAEAIRVFKKSPAWKAGVQNNRPVRVLYTIPLVFQLDE